MFQILKCLKFQNVPNFKNVSNFKNAPNFEIVSDSKRATFENFGQFLGNFWQIAKTFGNFGQLLVTLSNFGQLLETLEIFLRKSPHFRKVILRISRQNCDKSAFVYMEGHLCMTWSYFQLDACRKNFWKPWAIFGQLLANSDNFWQLLATYSNVCLSRISKMPQFSEDVQQLKMPHNSKCSKFQICSKFWKCFKYWKCSKFWNCSRLKNVNI